MDIIEIEDMEFYAFHGCFEAEKVVGNKFIVQARLETDCSLPAKTDKIEDALNYQTVYDRISEQMKIPSSLLEHVCNRILDVLFAEFSNQLISAQIFCRYPFVRFAGKVRKVRLCLRLRQS